MSRSIRERLARRLDPATYKTADVSTGDVGHPSPDKMLCLCSCPIHVRLSQLRFLLSQAPMIDAPVDVDRLRAARTPYAFVHPKTWARLWPLTGRRDPSPVGGTTEGSPTRWTVTTLMPEDRVIYSTQPLPGTARRTARPLV